ncbi:hypothetical protein A3I90_00220 [Candidatus Nomurabacteria bacterium RIFCSPLOWO2_02_FULL_41_9]|nr:MAG: hypothetical protein A3I90_00220 [Candidatus Nomurabacteria bacterium RIFCSPLOWO2_02_FULL_41_9]
METQNYPSYTVKTSVFEGPLGLLLDLVEKRKLHICNFSLAEVTEDYLKYVNDMGKLSPGETAGFLVVASTLILIKSKSLLPSLDLSDEEKGDIKDLEEKLRLYDIFSKLSAHVKDNFGRKIIFAALEKKNNTVVFLPDERITKESMMTFAREALGAMPQKVFMPEVEVKKVMSIEEMLDRLSSRIKDAMKMSFREFTGSGKAGKTEKIEVIVGFLAMLELVRQGIIHATQEGDKDIIIMKNNE